MTKKAKTGLNKTQKSAKIVASKFASLIILQGKLDVQDAKKETFVLIVDKHGLEIVQYVKMDIVET